MPTLIDDGLNLNVLDETTQSEIDTYLGVMRRTHAPLYEMTANALWLDCRPDFVKLHRRGARIFGRVDGVLDPVRGPLTGLALLFDYILLGWEDGILNQIDSLRSRKVSKAQIMEVVMAAQIWGGMRSLQCVYRAADTYLRQYQDMPAPAAFPSGWAPDVDAFKCGLDISTLDLTDDDRANLFGWYERTIGYVPRSVQFADTYNPAFLKAYRLKWENAFKGALPKQMMPLLMLRSNVLTGRRDGMREAALLAKAWGVGREWVVHNVMHLGYYFVGLEGLYAAEDALGDILGSWD
jgi:hypothetical protein